MKSIIRFRCDKKFKDAAENHALEKGFSNLSEYVRHLIKNDLKNGKSTTKKSA